MKEKSKICPCLRKRVDVLRFEPEVAAFENDLQKYFGVRHAVAIASGTAALHASLSAIGIKKGDEVIVSALAPVMSAVPIVYLGATPVFVDCANDTVDFDYRDLIDKITTKTRAIIPVHLWGYPYDMKKLKELARNRNLLIIEDACQAHGSKCNGKFVGTWGNAGCFSLRNGKLMSTGEGGFILTNDDSIAEHCRSFRNHFTDPLRPDMSFQAIGMNYRLTGLQALIGRRELEDLEANVKICSELNEYLANQLRAAGNVIALSCPNCVSRNFYSSVFLTSRNLPPRSVATTLAAQGVINSVGTFGLRPLSEWKVFKRYSGGPLKCASELTGRAIAITISPQDTKRRMKALADIIKATLNNY